MNLKGMDILARYNPSAKVLIVEDELLNLKLFETLLAPLGYDIYTARDGLEAIEKVNDIKPDLILLDVMMPKLNGYEVCKRLKSNAETRLIPIIILTALDQLEDRVRGIECGAEDFLSKPVNRVELIARTKTLIKIKKMNDNLEDAENLLYTLAKAVEAKDAYTEGHVERVSGISAFIAKKIGLSHTEVEVCRKGGVLHDIGKVGVPDYLLNKPGKLTVEEMDIIMMHPVIGAEICQSLRSLGDIIHIIRHHHEKLNGSGYPDKLKGNEIQVAAQIVAVVDIFDALSSDRPYRLGLPTTKVFQILDGMEANGEINNLALNCLKENYHEIRTLV